MNDDIFYGPLDLPDPPRKPTSRDDLLRGLESKVAVPSSTRHYAWEERVGWAKSVARRGEWFDFGSFDLQVLIEASKDANDLAEANLLNLPFPICVFRCRSTPDNMNQKSIDYLQRIAKELNHTFDNEAVTKELVYLMTQKDAGSPINIMLLSISGLNHERCGVMGFGSLQNNQWTDVKHDDKIDNLISGAIPIAFSGMWLILNTKNIEKVREEPGEKLNKARVRNGKAPLKPVTRINVGQYVSAMRETQRMESAGTSTSRKIHLRRGHLRHYNALRFNEELRQKPIWISPMIIGGDFDQDGTPKQTYKVITK